MSDCKIVEVMESEYYLADQPGQPLLSEVEWTYKDTGETGTGLCPHQRRILNEAFRQNEDGTPRYRTVVYSCPKKSGKTALGGAVTYAALRVLGGNSYSLANDREQAGGRMFDRVIKSLLAMKTKQPDLFFDIIDPRCHERLTLKDVIYFNEIDQVNAGQEHWLKFVASDYAGEAGGMPAFTGWDELWGFRTDSAYRLWDEMQPIPTIKSSIRFITTYAGWHGESALLWSIYNAVVVPDESDEPQGERVPGLEDLPCFRKGEYFVYWDHDARMPWHTEEFMAAAKDDPALDGRESEYKRIWENRWTTGLDSYIDMSVIDSMMRKGSEAGLYNHIDALYKEAI